MTIKMQVDSTSYTLYCAEAPRYMQTGHPQYVYSSAGEPGFANFPKPTCMFESVEKAQAKINTFIKKAETAKHDAEVRQAAGVDRFPETAEWNVQREVERIALINTFVIVKLEITECAK